MRWSELPPTGVAWWFLLYFCVGFIGTWLARNYALRHDLLDLPGERRSHDTATPRGGGIAIVVAMLLAIAWSMLRDPARVPTLAAVGCGLVLVAGAGWADDHRPVSEWLRLAIHALAAGLLAWSVHHAAAGWLATASAFILTLVLINVWNFMDGIDALATSQALIVAGGYAVLAGNGPIAMLAIALVAACLGFLPFNLPKARIFLGDVGSGALGYMLAALVVLLAMQDLRGAPVLLLPLSAFLIDASLTLAARIVRREHWWLPHAQHAYQACARRAGRHGGVALAYAGWTLVATTAMLAAQAWVPTYNIVMFVTIFLAGVAAWFWMQRDPRWIARGNDR